MSDSVGHTTQVPVLHATTVPVELTNIDAAPGNMGSFTACSEHGPECLLLSRLMGCKDKISEMHQGDTTGK